MGCERRRILTGERLTTTRSVWVVNSDGTGRQQVTSNGWLPQWSPDGTRLAFADSDGYRVLNPRWHHQPITRLARQRRAAVVTRQHQDLLHRQLQR